MLEEEHVPRAPELSVGEESLSHRATRGNGRRDERAEPFGREHRCSGRDARPPVVPDQHGLPVTAERLMQRDHVGDRRAVLVAPLRVEPGGCVAAEPRSDGAKAGRGQFGQQETPRPRAVGEPMQAQGQRTVVAAREVAELDLVDRHPMFSWFHPREH